MRLAISPVLHVERVGAILSVREREGAMDQGMDRKDRVFLVAHRG